MKESRKVPSWPPSNELTTLAASMRAFAVSSTPRRRTGTATLEEYSLPTLTNCQARIPAWGEAKPIFILPILSEARIIGQPRYRINELCTKAFIQWLDCKFANRLTPIEDPMGPVGAPR